MNQGFHERPLVYLAGPYQHPDPVENTNATIHMANYLQDTGRVTVFVPHLTMLWHAITPLPPEHWYAYDFAFLARCDALMRMPGDSTGADNEVAFAEKRSIPVFHDTDHLITWAARP